MRSREEILREYEEVCSDSRMVSDKNYSNVYKYANQELREKLRKEYNETLSKEQRFAIYLHDKFCKSNHTDMCSWYYEFNNQIEHEWNRYAHKKYLEIAIKLIDEGIYYDEIEKVLKILSIINR